MPDIPFERRRAVPMTVTSSGCPECGGTGARGCGAGWHDGKPDAPSPLGEPTAVPTRPTREQATQALLDATEAISAYINAGGADGCLDSANVIGIWSTDGRQARITQGDLRRIAEVRAALLAGEGTAQPDPSEWAERVREATTEVLDQKDLVVGLEAMCDHGSKQWAQLVYNSHERLRRASGDGTAPPVPAEVVRELIEAHDAVEEGLVSFDLHNAAVTRLEAAWAAVRVVAADGAPQEGDERG